MISTMGTYTIPMKSIGTKSKVAKVSGAANRGGQGPNSGCTGSDLISDGVRK